MPFVSRSEWCSNLVAVIRAGRPRLCISLSGWLCAWLLGAGSAYAATANPAPRPFDFAVLGNMPLSAAEVPDVRRLFEAVEQRQKVAFMVHDGNLKGSHENCGDDLLSSREALLNDAPLPLIYVPGVNDWIDCASPQAGGFDPAERLDFIRQNFFGDATSLGTTPYPLVRQSDIPRFRPYRENVRWEYGDVLFITLNVPSDNNHFSYAGGRNGEFDDRLIANAFWLHHALEYAKRRKSRAIVIFIQGNPNFPVAGGRDTRGSFSWWRFGKRRLRDGYREFRKDLFELSENFAGPVLLVHGGTGNHAAGFKIDQPRDDELEETNKSRAGRKEKSRQSDNLTRVEVFNTDRPLQWLEVHVDTAHRPIFHLSLQHVPPGLPPALAIPAEPTSDAEPMQDTLPEAPTLLPLAPASESAPEVPGLPGQKTPQSKHVN